MVGGSPPRVYVGLTELRGVDDDGIFPRDEDVVKDALDAENTPVGSDVACVDTEVPFRLTKEVNEELGDCESDVCLTGADTRVLTGS